jgi:hypothetical protein
MGTAPPPGGVTSERDNMGGVGRRRTRASWRRGYARRVKVGEHVGLALDAWDRGEAEHAMLHACIAVDGTARKAYPATTRNKARFTSLLRDNYDVLGPMSAPGVNLAESFLPVKMPHAKEKSGPDFAELIYGVHRCTHGHGDELPGGFELIPNAALGMDTTTLLFEKSGKVRLSDRVIFGLLAVAVFAPANADERVPNDGYHFVFGKQRIRLQVNDWWGRHDDFAAVVASEPMPYVKLDFGDWMPEPT